MMGRLSALLMALTALAPLACGPAATPSPRPVQPEAAPSSGLQDADWGRFRSHRHGLSVPLPDGKSWRIDDHSDPWLDARHPGTGTRLRARTWIEPRPVNLSYCEAEARRFDPGLPQTDEASTIDAYETDALFAPEFSSRVVVGLGEMDPRSESIQGHVFVVGVAGRRCVVLSYTAGVSGPKSSTVLAEWLELGTRIVDNTLFVSRLPAGPLEPMPTP